MVLFFNHLAFYLPFEYYAIVHEVSLIDKFSRVITQLLAVFELVSFLTVPCDPPVHYHMRLVPFRRCISL